MLPLWRKLTTATSDINDRKNDDARKFGWKIDRPLRLLIPIASPGRMSHSVTSPGINPGIRPKTIRRTNRPPNAAVTVGVRRTGLRMIGLRKIGPHTSRVRTKGEPMMGKATRPIPQVLSMSPRPRRINISLNR